MNDKPEYKSLEDECMDKFGALPCSSRLPHAQKDAPIVLTDKAALAIIANTNKRIYEELLALRTQLASADKDRERMDILSKNPSDLSWDDEKNLWHFSWSAGKGYGYSFLHRDIRVVIDAIASSDPDAALQPSPSLDHGAMEKKAP